MRNLMRSRYLDMSSGCPGTQDLSSGCPGVQDLSSGCPGRTCPIAVQVSRTCPRRQVLPEKVFFLFPHNLCTAFWLQSGFWTATGQVLDSWTTTGQVLDSWTAIGHVQIPTFHQISHVSVLDMIFHNFHMIMFGFA